MRSLLVRVGAWPVGTKVAALVVALLVLVGGAGAVIAPRLAHGRPVRSTARPSAPARTSPSAGARPTSSPVALASTLSCTLPISRGNSGSGGFLAFPQGTFTADPQSAVTSNAFTGLTYDRAVSKWLPVRRSAVAPDGSRYASWAYQPFGAGMMVAVTAATGAEASLGPRPGGAASAARVNAGFWSVVEATDAGVYAAPGGAPGLWLFPWSGTGERQVTGSGFWQEVGGGAAWGTASQSVPEGAANVILRLDLADGTTTGWFSRPGLQSTVMGFDLSGHPVVQAMSKDVTEVWLVTGQNNGTKLLTVPPGSTQGANRPSQPNLQSVVGDDKGIWLATSDGLYLSTSSTTEKVSAVTGQLGGGCA